MATGILRDRYGTRYTVIGVMMMVAVGIVLLGVAGPNDLVVFAIGYFLIGGGGGLTLASPSFLGSLHLSTAS